MKQFQWVEFHSVATTSASKVPNTDRVVLMLERDQFIFPIDSGFAIDAPHFVEMHQGTRKVREAESGHHDDGVMMIAIAFSILEKIDLTRMINALTAMS